MGTVIEFPTRSVETLTGPCKCFKCGTEWIGVMPVGTEQVECPACGCMGVKAGLVSTGGSRIQWHCGCGCFVFRIDTHGPYCVECGRAQPVHWV